MYSLDIDQLWMMSDVAYKQFTTVDKPKEVKITLRTTEKSQPQKQTRKLTKDMLNYSFSVCYVHNSVWEV